MIKTFPLLLFYYKIRKNMKEVKSKSGITFWEKN